MLSEPKDDLPDRIHESEEIVRRALALGITGTPDKASHNLGLMTLGSGETVTVHVIHAVDAVITDGKNVVVINRKNPPNRGKPALPGGFIDPIEGGGIEDPIVAARREAWEETGAVLEEGILIGQRNMNRPYDIRRAYKDLPQYGIQQGDLFIVSTQAVRFDVEDVTKLKLVAGDDAELPRPVSIASLSQHSMGAPDHFDMIVESIGGRQHAVETLGEIRHDHATRAPPSP